MKNNKLLIEASQRGDLETLERLVNNGAQVNAKEGEALIKASENGHLETARWLLEHGAHADAQESEALITASANGHLEILRLLLEHGARVDAQDNLALFEASQNGHFDILELLLEYGAIVQESDALNGASENGQLETVMWLLNHGAQADVQENEALIGASEHGHLEILELLIRHGAQIDAQGGLALIKASENGHLETLKFLIKNGITIDAPGGLALIRASANGHWDIVQLLLQNGAQNNHSIHRILHEALSNGSTTLTNYIIQYTDVHLLDIPTNRGYTAVHIAVQQGQIEILNRLINAGADLNRVTHSGFTPLHMAIIDSHLIEVKKLIDGGADLYIPYVPVADSITANHLVSDCDFPNLHLAVAVDNIQCIEILLDAGFDINTRNNCDQTVLHIAYKFGRPSLADKLIELGADVSQRDNSGRLATDLDASSYELKAHNCSVTRSHFKYSCYTKRELVEIAKAWNKKTRKPSRKIKTGQNLIGLIDSLKNRLGPDEWCWANRVKSELRNELPIEEIFRPDGGQVLKRGQIVGVYNEDTRAVLKQYEQADPTLKTLVIVEKKTHPNKPFYKLEGKKYLLYSEYLDTLFRDYNKIAIFFSVSRHAHALFINTDRREIDYFDSALPGKPVKKIIQKTINMIVSTAKNYAEEWEVNYNKTTRQDYGSDCAIYSLYYLTNRIKDVPFSEITSRPLRPEDIYRYRMYYFRPPCSMRIF